MASARARWVQIVRALIGVGVGAAAAAGCGDDGGSSMMEDAGMGDAMVEPDSSTGTDAGTGDAGSDDAGTGSDGNDSFDTAETLTVGSEDGAMGVINPAGDLDYYRFEVTEAGFYLLSTTANEEDDPELVDTVITLYDDGMTQIAENDDSVPRVNTDSELITYLAAGTYFILVQEFSSWFEGETPEGAPDFNYVLNLFQLNPDAPAVTADAEGGDDGSSAQALGFDMDFSIAVGRFDDADDIDVFSVEIGGEERRSLATTVMPMGPEGYGSTTPVQVWVTDASGTTIIGRVDHGAGQNRLAPSLEPGSYLLWVEHGADAAGSNDFYVLKSVRSGENPLEADDAGNNDVAGAETLPLMDGDGLRAGFILTELDPIADQDHYNVMVQANETLTVACASASVGSGVEGLSVAVLDDMEAELASATEDPAEGLFIEDGGAVEAGTYTLRFSKTGQSADVTGTWVRCGVRALPR
jgi:hypothetical protein